jgi:hypothetical protein
MQFGQSVALVGNYAIIGAPGPPTGAAYVFSAITGDYLAKINNPGNGVYFGGGNGQNAGLASINGMLVAGSTTTDVNGNFNAGTIYLFAVPEPGSLAFIATSVSFVILGTRKRRKRFCLDS